MVGMGWFVVGLRTGWSLVGPDSRHRGDTTVNQALRRNA
jgi:hypothetical protein